MKNRSLFLAAAYVVVLACLLSACNKAEPKALDTITDLGPIEEFAEYKTVVENTEPGKRGRYFETPKMVIVVRPGLAKADLERIGNAYIKAHPGKEIDIFDSKAGLDDYVNLDSYDERSPYKTKMTLDDDFRIKHLIARVRGVGDEWFVSTERYDPMKYSVTKPTR